MTAPRMRRVGLTGRRGVRLLVATDPAAVTSMGAIVGAEEVAGEEVEVKPLGMR